MIKSTNIGIWNSEYIVFSISRAIGILVRPVILYLLISNNFDEFADDYSRLIIVMVSIFSFLAFPYYYDFYKEYFENNDSKKVGLKYVIYLKDFFLFNILLVPLTVVLSYALFKDIYISLGCSVLLFFEKIIDEFQRFQQYKKNFLEWSILFLTKNFFPIILFLSLFVLFDFFSFESYMFSIIAVNIAISLFYSLKQNVMKFIRINKKYFTSFIKRVFGKNFLIYLISISSVLILQSDRLVLSQLENSIFSLADLTFAAQLANLLPLVVSFGFIANRRQLILKKETSISNLFLGKVIPLVCVVLFVVILSVIILLSQSGYLTINLSNKQIFIYFLAFSFISLNQILHEHLYWNLDSWKLLLVDILLLILFFLLSASMPENLIELFALVCILRFSIHLLQKIRLDNSYRI